MTVRSLQEHVQTLIDRKVAEAKVDGANSPDIEARAILESIALNLLLKPKSILYLAHLARNALQNTVRKELLAVDALSKTVEDTANVTFTPPTSTALSSARTSLLKMESLEKVDVAGGDYQRFSKSIDDFLNKSLAKSVRKLGQTELVRPSTEAEADLSTDFQSLLELHNELNERLLSLSVGVQNFTDSSIGTILGLSTAFRARQDLEEIIDLVDSGDSASQARDIAVRLIGSRAAVKSIGTLPSVDSLLLDTANNLPSGYVLKVESDPAAAEVTSVVGPFVLDPSTGASVSVNGSSIVESFFPQAAVHLNNRAFVSSSQLSFPVTIPTGTFLFVQLRRATASTGYVPQGDGSFLKQVKVSFPIGPISLAQVLTSINSALGADASAVEYVKPGTNKLILIGNSSITSIALSSFLIQPSTSSVGDQAVLLNSAHTLLGFSASQTGEAGSTPLGIMVDAFNVFFGTLVTATQTDDQKLKLSTLLNTSGTSLTVSISSSVGITGTAYALSDTLKLFGSVYGISTNPVDPNPLLDIGDLVTTPFGDSAVKSMTTTRLVLDSSFRTFYGDISAKSALTLSIRALEDAIQVFLTDWLKSSFVQGLQSIDRAVAALSGKSTPAARNAVLSLLVTLKTKLQTLSTTLTTGLVPSNIGTEERTVIEGIISTLIERRYDRALKLFLSLDIQEFFEVSAETASFGADLLKKMSDIAITDINFPNTEIDEGSGLKGKIEEPEA